jgi:hypothetical protein
VEREFIAEGGNLLQLKRGIISVGREIILVEREVILVFISINF